MFGMLDYRAHKLFLILFGIPIYILKIVSLFGLPFLAYLLGFKFVEAWALKILLSIGSLVIIEILWTIFVFLIFDRLTEFIFALFVDVIPADGRTKEEAKLVVYQGEKAITSLLAKKHPKEWTDENIQDIAKLDWIGYLFFGGKIVDRMEQVRAHFTENTEIHYNEWNLEEFIKQSNVPMKWQETAFSGPVYRRAIFELSIFLLFILVNPLSI